MPKTYYAIGDVHGHLDMLKKLWEAISVDAFGLDGAPAQLVFLGDYIDRGPDSRRVVGFIRSIVENSSAIALCGNHEDMAIKALIAKSYDSYRHWVDNGGRETLASYVGGANDEQLRSDLEWMERLPYIHEEDDIIFVHGGIDPAFWPIHDSERCMWTRGVRFMDSCNWMNPALKDKLVVHGHSPVIYNPIYKSRGQRINVDYGAGSGLEGVHLAAAKITPDRKVTIIKVDEALNVTTEELEL